MTYDDGYRARLSELHAEVDEMAEKAADRFVDWVGDEDPTIREDLAERFAETFHWTIDQKAKR